MRALPGWLPAKPALVTPRSLSGSPIARFREACAAIPRRARHLRCGVHPVRPDAFPDCRVLGRSGVHLRGQRLGIPHPPGNPLFTLLAHVWGMLPLTADYAKRINLFAACCSAASAGIWFLVAERWLRSIVPDRGPRLLATFAGIFAGATAWTVWNQSVVNEKVYTVSLLSIALVAWLAVRWADDEPGPRRDRRLLAAIFIVRPHIHQPHYGCPRCTGPCGVCAAPQTGALNSGRGSLAAHWLSRSSASLPSTSTCRFAPPSFLPSTRRTDRFLLAGVDGGAQSAPTYLKPRCCRAPAVGTGQAGQQSQAPSRRSSACTWHYWSWQWGRTSVRLLFAHLRLPFTCSASSGLVALMRRDRRAGPRARFAGALTLTVSVAWCST